MNDGARQDSRGLRILQVIPWLTVRSGGPATTVVNLAGALEAAGATVTVFATDASAPRGYADGKTAHEDALPAGADALDIEWFPLRQPYRYLYSPAMRRALARRMGEFDLVHIHSLYTYPQYAAWRAAVDRRVPYVVSPRGTLDPYMRRRGRGRKWLVDSVWQRRMLDRAAALHLTSDEERRLLEDLRILSPHHVLPNGVNLATYAGTPSPQSFRDRFLRGSSAPIVLNHGRIASKKGLDILIAAMAEVRRRIPDAHLVLVGPDDEGIASTLQSQADRLGLGQALTFPGVLTGDALQDALAAADIWALPSHTENFGMAVIEAMAAGRPVVTSPHVNIAGEAAAAGALVVADNTADAFATAIVALWQDAERRRLVSDRAVRFARRFDWAALGERYLAFYRSLVERDRLPATDRQGDAWDRSAMKGAEP